MADAGFSAERAGAVAFDYPNATWTIATIPVLAILLIIGWRWLQKQRDAVKHANQQEAGLRWKQKIQARFRA